MSILVRWSPVSLTAAQYDEATRRLNKVVGDGGPDGAEYHCCFGTDGNLKVSEVWESKEKFEAFGKTLLPILADVGIDPGEPEILPVHNTLP